MSNQFHQMCETQATEAAERCGFELGKWEAWRGQTLAGFSFIEFVGDKLESLTPLDRVELKDIVARVTGMDADELSLRPSERGFYIVNMDLVAKAKELGKTLKVPAFKLQAPAPKPQPKRESWLDYMPEI